MEIKSPHRRPGGLGGQLSKTNPFSGRGGAKENDGGGNEVSSGERLPQGQGSVNVHLAETGQLTISQLAGALTVRAAVHEARGAAAVELPLQNALVKIW
jgi:hypothetical protein